MIRLMIVLAALAFSASVASAQTTGNEPSRNAAISVLSYCMFDGRQYSMGVTICNPLFNGKQGHSLTCDATDPARVIATTNPAVWKMKAEPDCPVPPYASGR